MLKDHVDFDALTQSIRDYVAGKIPQLPTVAEWVRVKAGDRCDGCGGPLRPGTFVQKALADGSIGHAHCHAGAEPIRVTHSRRSRRGSA
jgi:hypothetical protein